MKITGFNVTKDQRMELNSIREDESMAIRRTGKGEDIVIKDHVTFEYSCSISNQF